jgi:hypothetical protein
MFIKVRPRRAPTTAIRIGNDADMIFLFGVRSFDKESTF